jgi:hypothetical protein
MCNLTWHLSDSYATSETSARGSFYGVGGIPDVWFDGSERVLGGGTNMRPYYEPIITRRLDLEPYIAIDLSGSSIDENGGTVNIHLEVLQDITVSNPKVKTFIYQNDIIGEFWMVRDVLTDEDLTALNVGETQDIVKDFVIDPGWYGLVEPENIGAAVIVQSQSAKTVLNACDLSKIDVEITPETATVPMGTDLDITIHLTNITPWRQPVQLWLDVVLPNGTEYPRNPFEGPVDVNVPSGADIDYPMTISIPDGIPAADYRLRLAVGDQTNDAVHFEYDYMTVTVTP